MLEQAGPVDQITGNTPAYLQDTTDHNNTPAGATAAQKPEVSMPSYQEIIHDIPVENNGGQDVTGQTTPVSADLRGGHVKFVMDKHVSLVGNKHDVYIIFIH